MTEKIAGVAVPDSALAREATEFIREVEPPLLYDHSRRVYFFGSLQGKRLGLKPDAELLYVGAMFHDLGLTEGHRSDQRFELDGADAARRFLASRNVPEIDVRKVWEAIALHTTPEVPYRLEPEVALVTAGVETDVLGFGYGELAKEDIDAVVAAHPRPDFKNRILRAFTDGFKDRPGTTFGTMNADVLEHFVPDFKHTDFVEVIRDSDWPE
ncbi:HD domain-containing protein [Acrocarpospora macrocephala]|uniref:Phosphohydrolase n=1 Tax=Acrocarpospora macrocephala TaxID=150177 RepID=A0A5M3WY27_9ACTN|nr:HD domain-containing protein [Acrocarpospora macrocephala]GES13660.1 phosphohydrolase [Acrocarpospora macrocephala]